jgi:DNA-binding CsgD family transcriptional regulator
MMRQVEIPSELRRLLEAAEGHDAAAVVYDEKDNLILTNYRYREIYSFVDFSKPQTYSSIVWRCVELELLDDPVFHSDPEAWLSRANNFRERYKLAQYLITHERSRSSGARRTYLAHHQKFDGVGTLATRFDITDKFYIKGVHNESPLSGFDPVGTQWFTSVLSRNTEVASAIVSRSAKVIDANAEFRRIVSRGDGIGLESDRMFVSSGAENARFNKMVIEKSDINADSYPSVIKVPSFSSEGSYIVSVTPLLSSPLQFRQSMHGVALVSIIDPYWEPPIDTQMLRNVFGLTVAESRVAASVGVGKDLSEIACENNVSIGTVRNQLKSVFQKTGISKQSEVVRLVHRMSALGVKKSVE